MQNFHCKQIMHHLLLSTEKIKEIGLNCLALDIYFSTYQIPIKFSIQCLREF